MNVTTMESNSARANWRKLLDMASAGEDIVVTRFGLPIATVIRYDDYVALLDEIDDLRAARHADAIVEAIEAGRTDTVPWEDVKGALVAEGLLDG